MLALLILFAARSFAMVAYDCNHKSVNLTAISLVTTPSCESISKNITTEVVDLALTQSAEHMEIPYIRCHVETFNYMGRCGKTIDTYYPDGLFSEVVPLSREDCVTMINKLTLRVTRNGDPLELHLSAGGETRQSYVSRGSVTLGGSCSHGASFIKNGKEYDRPVTNTDLRAKYSKGKALLNVEENLVKFPNGNTCKYQDETCYDADYGYIFWSIVKPQCSGVESEKHLVYSGKGQLITDFSADPVSQYVQVNHNGYDFQILLLSRVEYICGYRSHHTEHPSLFATILPSDGPAFGIKRKIPAVDVSLMNFVNSKLVYSFRHTQKEVTRLYEMFNQDRCKIHNRVTQNLMTLAVLSPPEFAFAYGGAGYTAVTRGEVVYLARCKPVPVLPNLSSVGCYNELPVTMNNQSRFMLPRSRVLIDVGTPVECLPDLLPKFFIDNTWLVKTAHGLVDVSAPHTISPEPLHYQFKELAGLSGGGLYSTEIIKKYQNAIISPMVENVITSRVAGSVQGTTDLPAGYSFTNGFSLTDYSKISEKIGSWWDSFYENSAKRGGFIAYLFVWYETFRFCLYVISCIFNYKHLKTEIGWLLAIPFCLIECLCSMILHGRAFQRFRKNAENPPKEEENLEMLTYEQQMQEARVEEGRA